MKKLLCISFPSSKSNGVGFSELCNDNKSLSFIYFSKKKHAILKNSFRILRECLRNDVIVINYISLFLLFGPISKLFFKKVIFIPHEGEPLFPKDLKKDIAFPRSLISSINLTKLCVFLAHETYSLSSLQAKMIGAKEDKLIHFGVDPRFVSADQTEKVGCFFPNRKTELIKGYEQIHVCHHLISNHNSMELSSNEMATFYNESKIVLITSIIETYSYCMVEAMQANCTILTTKGVGLACDLLYFFGEEKLNSSGIFIFDSASDAAEYLVKNIDFLSSKKTKTKELAREFGLSGEAAQLAFNSMNVN